MLNTLKDRMFLVLTHVNVDKYLDQLHEEREAELANIAEIEEKNCERHSDETREETCKRT
nr:peptidoglycan bridge formation glycyltransferase FemA/FemB family protein [Jeotgalicoccus sp. WY2]